jgi:hypothetical protein
MKISTGGVDGRGGGQQQADADPDRDGQDDQAGDGLAAAAGRQPQAEADHGACPGEGTAPVSELTVPTRMMTPRSSRPSSVSGTLISRMILSEYTLEK